MRQETKPVWIANDGQQFDNEQDCIDYENEKVFDGVMTGDFLECEDLGRDAHAILYYHQFKRFCAENKDWVIKNVIGNKAPEEKGAKRPKASARGGRRNG